MKQSEQEETLAETRELTDIYLEIGQKKACAVAVEWPGWCRFGKQEGLAAQALVDYGPRYAKIPQTTGLTFEIPKSASAFNIIDRLEGSATTDFGAPDKPLPNDWDPIGNQELQRMKLLLNACWTTFDAAVKMATGKELRKGPRGGGRQRKVLIRDEVLHGLEATANGQLPREGPRGGPKWSPRFFIRRLAWHVVDHTWEIEDRIIN